MVSVEVLEVPSALSKCRKTKDDLQQPKGRQYSSESVRSPQFPCLFNAAKQNVEKMLKRQACCGSQR
eukprot:2322757-Amphidinium_carterae.1